MCETDKSTTMAQCDNAIGYIRTWKKHFNQIGETRNITAMTSDYQAPTTAC